jgi:hypothetical protein
MLEDIILKRNVMGQFGIVEELPRIEVFGEMLKSHKYTVLVR